MAEKKLGRPKLASDIKKSNRLNIVLNDSENQKLSECVEFYGITKTAVLLNGLDIMYADMVNEKKNNGTV